MTSLEGRFIANSDLIETRLPDELILLDPTTQQMFSLTGAGPVIWDTLRGDTVAGAAQLLTRRFDVSAEVAIEHVRALVAQLVDAHLIRPHGDDA